jgi:hypothetical protein
MLLLSWVLVTTHEHNNTLYLFSVHSSNINSTVRAIKVLNNPIAFRVNKLKCIRAVSDNAAMTLRKNKQ